MSESWNCVTNSTVRLRTPSSPPRAPLPVAIAPHSPLPRDRGSDLPTCIDWSILDTSREWNHVTCGPLGQLLSPSVVFPRSIRAVVTPPSFPWLNGTRGPGRPHSVCPLTRRGTPGWLPPWGCCDAALHMHVQRVNTWRRFPEACMCERNGRAVPLCVSAPPPTPSPTFLIIYLVGPASWGAGMPHLGCPRNLGEKSSDRTTLRGVAIREPITVAESTGCWIDQP